MKSISRAVAVLALLLPTLAARSDDPAPLRGFSAARSADQRRWEAKFRDLISPDTLRESMRRLTARPHHLGSAYDRDNAEWLYGRFRSWGLEASIDTFAVLFPTPKERVVELVAPTKFVAKLQEPPLKGDPTSGQQSEQLPTYNAYSTDGDVTAPLVYVNYGTPADYEQLERLGLSAKGAIVIARYGAAWRGLKPKLAAEHGAVGCLIYSDPQDDGFVTADPYPTGGSRPNTGVQRGSVKDMPVSPGDPLTPGYGARPNAKRLPIDSALGITKIPVLPISYGDAQPLLAALGGPLAPGNWRGGLPITYHVGPGPATVHLKVKAEWKLTPLYDVIGKVPGTDAKDEWILRGNHHDAWVNGAEDPISGQIALLEEARGLGALMKQGWRPRRTIIFAAWDGEEEGLLGSTEFAEQHAEELRKHAVVYINSDGNGRGFLGAAGSHTLENTVNDAAREITDPETGLSVWKRLQLSRIANAAPPDRKEARERSNLRIGALGSGSDYSPFLQHLGIASLDLGFGGEEPTSGGVYHSIYDSFAYYTRFDDTNFVYGRALAQLAGTIVMRLANADLLPYRPTDFAETVGRYVDEVKTLATTRRDSIAEVNQQVDEGVFHAVSDPRQPLVAPAKQAAAPFLNFAPLENALTNLTKSAERYEAAFGKVSAGDGSALERPEVREVNRTLKDLEWSMTDEAGLPGRGWYRHFVYAPGLLTGYGVKTLPAVRESIELGQWSEVDGLVARTAAALDRTSQTINTAAEAIEKATPN